MKIRSPSSSSLMVRFLIFVLSVTMVAATEDVGWVIIWAKVILANITAHKLDSRKVR